jgi:hypothetical protein
MYIYLINVTYIMQPYFILRSDHFLHDEKNEPLKIFGGNKLSSEKNKSCTMVLLIFLSNFKLVYMAV